MNTVFKLLPIVALISALSACGTGSTGATGAAGANGANGVNGTNGTNGTNGANGTPASNYLPGNLLVSRGVFDTQFKSIAGNTLPYNPQAPAAQTTFVTVPATGGTFPLLFTTESTTPDGNFGITAAAYIDQWVPGAASASTTTNITAQAKASFWDFTTSFASKSELALNVSLDKRSVTFMGYNAPIDGQDLSNSDTPGLRDSTNTDTATPTYRTVAQLNFADNSLSFTPTNAYSGNNGRAAVLANGMYYIVGNAGNGSGQTAGMLDSLSMSTGVQSIVPNSTCFYAQVIGGFIPGTPGSTYTPNAGCGLGTISTPAKKGDQFGFSITTLAGAPAADKTGKDVNLRGLYVGPDGTMYVSKGSGGNGVNTVYQVGATAALANGNKLPQNAAITILPGFPTTLATSLPTPTTHPAYATAPTGVVYPFGMWIPASNPTIMFVADEGDGAEAETASDNGSGGLWVYQNQSGTWKVIGHLTAGLNLGIPYTVADTNKLYDSGSYTTTPDGLRNITGQDNGNGSYTIYGTTSTIGNSITGFDGGAESNQLVKINVTVSGTGTATTATGSFSVLQTAPYGQVLRGVAIVPTH